MKKKMVLYFLLYVFAVNSLIVFADSNRINHEIPKKDSIPETSVGMDEPLLFFNYTLYYNFNSMRMNYTIFVFEENHSNEDMTYNISIDGYCEITSEYALNETDNQTRFSIIWFNGPNVGYYYSFINTTEMELEQKRFFNFNLTYTCNSDLDMLKWGHNAPYGAGTNIWKYFRDITYHTREPQVIVTDIHDFHHTCTIMTDNTTFFSEHRIFWPNISRNVGYGEWMSSIIRNSSTPDVNWDNTTLDFDVGFVNWIEYGSLSVGSGYSCNTGFIRPTNETEIHQNWVFLTGLDYDPLNLSYPSPLDVNYSSRMELVFEWDFIFPNERYGELSYTFVQEVMEETCPDCPEFPECPDCPSIKWNWGEYLSVSLGSVILISLGTIVTLNVLKRRKKS